MLHTTQSTNSSDIFNRYSYFYVLCLSTEGDYEFDNSTFKFDGCNSRGCVNVTIIDDMIAEPLTRIRRDKFHAVLIGSGLDDRITLSTDISTIYIEDNDRKSFLLLHHISNHVKIAPCMYISSISLLVRLHSFIHSFTQLLFMPTT